MEMKCYGGAMLAFHLCAGMFLPILGVPIHSTKRCVCCREMTNVFTLAFLVDHAFHVPEEIWRKTARVLPVSTLK